MKILFAGRSIAHFTYYDTIIRALHDRGHSVVLLYDREWSGKADDSALRAAVDELENLTFEWSVRRTDQWRKWLTGARELRSYGNYARRKGQSEFYLQRWENYLHPRLRNWVRSRPALRRLLTCGPADKGLVALEAMAPADAGVLKQVRDHAPDVVVASPVNMRFSEEVEFLKAARKLGIPTAVPVLSWDNLSTKGLLHVKPSLVLAWNPAHESDAQAVHGIKSDHILVTGSPFFDKWFDAGDLEEDKAIFLGRMGLPADKPFILYMGSSRNIAIDETWVVEALHQQMRAHSDPRVAQASLLVRPHPANAENYKRLNLDGMVVWPKDGKLPEGRQDKIDFFNSVKHSAGTVAINTSGMIDALIYDKACVSPITEKYRRTQTAAVHFQYLMKSGALALCEGTDGMGDVVAGLILGASDPTAENRRRFVREFVRPHGLDRRAGDVAAEAIERLGKGDRPADIVRDGRADIARHCGR